MRYPADMPEPTNTELDQHIKIVERVRNAVRARIGEVDVRGKRSG